MKSKKAAVRNRYFHYIVFRRGDEAGMKKRASKDIWEGLYDFYLVEADQELVTEEVLLQSGLELLLPALTVGKISPVLTHLLTHQKVYARFWQVHVSDQIDPGTLALNCGIQFFEPTQIHQLPKPVMIDNYLKAHLF